MKLKHILILLFGILIGLNGYSQTYGYRSDNLLVPDRIIVSEHIPFDSIFINTSFQYLNESSAPIFEIERSLNFIETLAQKAMAGKIKIFNTNQFDFLNPFNQQETLQVEQLRKNLGYKQDTLLIYDEAGTEIKKLVVKEIDFNELKSINFIEEWSFTETPLQFKKNIIVTIPVRQYRNEYSDLENDFRYRRTFCFYNPINESKPKADLKLVANVKYEYVFNYNMGLGMGYLDKFIKSRLNGDFSNIGLVASSYDSPYFNSINQQLFIKTLIDKASEGKAKVFDYFTHEQLTPAEAKNRLVETKYLLVPDEYGEMQKRAIQRDLSDEILSVIFIENWYFDPETSQIQKKVVGIAPVRYFFDSENYEYDLVKRKVVFEVRME